MSTFTQVGKSYTAVAGNRATSNVGTSAAIRDVQKAMITFQPYQTPLLTKLMSEKTGRKPTGNFKFEYSYSTLVPRTSTVTLTGGAANEDNITVGSADLFQVGTMFVVDSTGEVCVVDSIASSQIDVTKVGSGNITAVTTATVRFIAPSFEEGSVSAQAISVNKNFEYNYTQEVKKAVQATGRQTAMVEYGEEDWMRNKRDRMAEWKIDIEASLLFGRTHLMTTGITGTYQQSFTGGLFYGSGNNAYINGVDTTALGSIDETYFFGTLAKNIFAKGSSTKRLYCGSGIKNKISSFSRANLLTKVGDKEYGVDIRKVETDFGLLEVVWHPMLEGTKYSAWGTVLDLEGDYIKYRFLNGNGVNRDFKFVDYPQFDENELKKGEWKADIGWQIEGDENHYLIEAA